MLVLFPDEKLVYVYVCVCVYVMYEEMCRKSSECEGGVCQEGIYTSHTRGTNCDSKRERRESECHSPYGVMMCVCDSLLRHSHECRHIYKREACTNQ